jgi:hypothetical protein
VTVAVTEERVAGRAGSAREHPALLARGRLRLGRCTRARRGRGLWDARLEALVVDSILTGEADEELPSRIAALGWHGHGEVAVLVGTTPPQFDVDQAAPHRPQAGVDVLIGVQGSRLVLVIGRAEPRRRRRRRTASSRSPRSPNTWSRLRPGHLVLGPAVPRSSTPGRAPARLSRASPWRALAWRAAPRRGRRPAPERALAGDPRQGDARRAHLPPLQAHSSDLVTTLWSYLDNGRSLEATARELFVHPNTVRYRLKRVSDVIGWDAARARRSSCRRRSSSARSARRIGRRGLRPGVRADGIVDRAAVGRAQGIRVSCDPQPPRPAILAG